MNRRSEMSRKKKESPDAVLEDPVHDEHRIAGAPLGVLDRTPSGRDDVAVDCGQPCARGVHIPSVPEGEAECGDRHAGSKRREEQWLHECTSPVVAALSPEHA